MQARSNPVLESHVEEILSRMTNDVDTISTTLQQSLTQMITSVVSILGYIIMMLTISPVMTLLVVASPCALVLSIPSAILAAIYVSLIPRLWP